MRVCKECGGKYYLKGYCSRHYQQILNSGKTYRTRYDPNEIIIKDDIAEIVLYNNKGKEVARTIIDVEDVEKVKKYKWHLHCKGYVVTAVKKKRVILHHFILMVKPNQRRQVDHRDQDKLNNRKSNFRFCIQRENLWNSGKRKTNTSGFKGVSWVKESCKWVAGIGVNYKTIHLGCFKKKKDAARAYNEAAIKYHGNFAYLNDV